MPRFPAGGNDPAGSCSTGSCSTAAINRKDRLAFIGTGIDAGSAVDGTRRRWARRTQGENVKSKTVCFAVSICLSFCAGAAGAAKPRPEPAAPTLERALLAMQPKSALPGYCVAVVDGSGVRYAKGFGYADIAQKRPYTADTVQPVASVSKPLIAVALMQQVESKALSLDTDVSTALPFAVHDPHAPSTPITLRQLATHSAGIVDREPFYTQSYVKGGQVSFDDRKLLQSYLDRQGSNYSEANFTKARPGAAYAYSNLGAALAALAVETKSGSTYRAYTRAHIFEPLHMDASGWSPGDSSVTQATLYDAHRMPLAPYTFPSYASSGLYTSCRDLGRFVAAMISGYQGRPGLLSPQGFRDMFAPQWPKKDQPKGVRPGDGLDQGLFWQRTERGELGHTGADSGVAARMSFNPVLGTGRVLITNTGYGDRPEVARELDSLWATLAKYEQNPEP
jgi:CubicO group peptidase (beta-lactamase class C family)